MVNCHCLMLPPLKSTWRNYTAREIHIRGTSNRNNETKKIDHVVLFSITGSGPKRQLSLPFNYYSLHLLVGHLLSLLQHNLKTYVKSLKHRITLDPESPFHKPSQNKYQAHMQRFLQEHSLKSHLLH